MKKSTVKVVNLGFIGGVISFIFTTLVVLPVIILFGYLISFLEVLLSPARNLILNLISTLHGVSSEKQMTELIQLPTDSTLNKIIYLQDYIYNSNLSEEISLLSS